MFTMEAVKHWNSLPGEVVGSPFLEILKIVMGKGLSNLVYLESRRLNWSSKVTCSLIDPEIL